MSTANELLSDIPIRVAQNEDDTYTIFAYDVVLDENGEEVSRSRMDLSAATVVQQVKDDKGKITGTPTEDLLFSVSTVTLTDSLKQFDDTFLGKRITVAGMTSPANDGTFPITGVPDSDSVQYTNPFGVAEPIAEGATYSISDIIIDKNSGDPAQVEIHPDQSAG